MSHFIDNLIPLRKRLNGVQYAGWKPMEIAESGLGCELYADEKIPMPDGVRLSADVYRPKTDRKVPAIVQFAAYSRELHSTGFPSGTNEIGCPPVFTERGYAHVVICRRGMGRSEGERQIIAGDADAADYCECIEWAAAQSWCDGNVVLFGTSYYGITQIQAAVRRPASLRAFFAHEICTDYFRHILRFGGTCNVNFLGLWQAANFTDGMIGLRVPPLVRALLSWVVNHEWLWKHVVRNRIDEMMQAFIKRTPARREREWFANWLGSNTREEAALGLGPYRDLGKIEIPFVVVQNLGYLNLHQFGTYDLFEHAATPADRKWMILEKPHYELPVYAWQLEALAFFDHVIKGLENGYRTQPPVRYWVEGEERYAGAGAFPLPSARRIRLYPTPRMNPLECGLLGDQPGQGTASWTAVPANTPIVGGMDEVMNQTLTFDLVVDEPATVAGPVTVQLRFSCNEIDSFIVARLGRVAADGGYHLLSMGVMSPARRREDPSLGSACEIVHDLEHPEPLVPGEPVNLRFSLTPSATRLEAGDRLRFEVGSRTDLLKGSARDGYVHFNLAVPPYFSLNTLHLGPETYVEVDVVAESASD